MSNSLSDILSFEGDGTRLLLGDIAPLESLISRATERDMAAIEGFTSPSRRAERLAWRIMVRESLGREIEVDYSDGGVPKINDLQYNHISVSHCADRVMVALSKKSCGVDIERLDRCFRNIAPRYMSQEELLLASDTAAMAAVWCAKECLYKMSGTSGIDLRHDIRITAIDLTAATITGQVKEGEPLTMHIMRPDDEHIAVYHI